MSNNSFKDDMRIYTGSTVKLRVDTGIDLTGIAVLSGLVAKIRWQNRNGSGVWVGDVDGTEIVYTAGIGDLDVPGAWSFQAVVETGDQVWKGALVRVVVDSPIEVE